MKYFWLLLCTVSLAGPAEFYIPLAPQDGTHRTQIILKSHHSEVVKFKLLAIIDKNNYTSSSVNMVAFFKVEKSVEELFPTWDFSTANVIKITADSEDVSISFVVSSPLNPENSTGEIKAIPRGQARLKLGFQELTKFKKGLSAPVIFNLGEDPAQVIMRAYANKEFLGKTQLRLEPGAAFSQDISELFPAVRGTIYLTATSNQPLIGASVLLHQDFEPAFAPSHPIHAPQ